MGLVTMQRRGTQSKARLVSSNSRDMCLIADMVHLPKALQTLIQSSMDLVVMPGECIAPHADGSLAHSMRRTNSNEQGIARIWRRNGAIGGRRCWRVDCESSCECSWLRCEAEEDRSLGS